MKALFLAAITAAFSFPALAFEKHELELGEPNYDERTGLTGYEVLDGGVCFSTYEEHVAHAAEKGLVFGGQFRLSPIHVLIVLRNEDDTYREVYLITAGEGGCLKAVGYAEGEPA